MFTLSSAREHTVINIEAASRRAYPLEDLPGTPRNRTGEFRLQLVRGGPHVENRVGRNLIMRVPGVPLGAFD